MNADMQFKLEKNEKIRNAIDVAGGIAFLLTLLAIFCWNIWDSYVTQTGFADVIASGLVVLIGGYVPFLLLQRWLPRFAERCAPSFLIDSSDPNVVKLYGSVHVDGADRALQKLLSSRPGLQMYRGDARQDFGCTLAATPATPEFMEAKEEMRKLGFTIN